MAKKTKFYSEGLGLVPVSADPASPAQGQMQYSDGTARAEGLWRYNGTEWVRLGGGGAIISDWVDFTPTGTWTTNTTYSGRYRRVGNVAEIQYSLILSGAPDATQLRVNLPAGLSADTSNLEIIGDEYSSGIGHVLDGAISRYQIKANYSTLTNDILVRNYETTLSYTRESAITNLAPITFASGDGMEFNITIPIVGWSTGILPNEISEGKLHTMALIGNGVTSLPNLVFTKLTNWDVPIIDESGAWDAVNSRYVVQETGNYVVRCGARVEDAIDGDMRRIVLSMDINGTSLYQSNQSDISLSTSPGRGADLDRIVKLNAGDYIEFSLYQDNGDGDTLNTAPSEEFFQYFEVTKLNNLSSQITPAETVAARYSTITPQSIGGTNTTIAYDILGYDTTNSYNNSTGVYTAPISGKYQISAGALLDTAAYSAGQGVSVKVLVDGTSVANNFTQAQTTASLALSAEVNTTIHLTAGQEVRIAAICSPGSTLSTVSDVNYFSITKVGN